MKKYSVAMLLVALAACVNIALRSFSSDFPALVPFLFLWAIGIVARYVDFRASILALSSSVALLDVFFFPSSWHRSTLAVIVVKTIFFSALGLALSVVMRNLREARASRARLAAIVDCSDDAILSLDGNGDVTSWNTAAERLFGYEAEEMIDRSILDIIPPEFQDREETILRKLREGKRFDHFETERLRKDGSRIKVSLTISPLLDSRRRVVGASTIARDITERIKMQEAFIESEKLAATGRMAAAIAHEINNPLEAVTNLAFLINTNKTLDSSAKQYSGMLMEEIHRISNLAKRSLTFFRDTGKPAEFDLAMVLDGVLELNNPLFAQKNISIRQNYAQQLLVFGSSAEMRQVFSNLIRNAIDAIGIGGEIEVRVRAARSGHWRISVVDNGHGIPVDARRKLFEPFLTTKGNTGNGLGLWISRGIVEKHGGQIRARSAVIAGRSWTVFSVVLPGAKVIEKRGILDPVTI
jgi:PAS domain S-box-containing protein